MRYEIESSLGRGFRGTAGLKGVQVISGNSFYTAKPVGIRNGVDYKLTGEVRKIEIENFKKRFDSGDIVLLTSLGHSNSGEVFNVPSELLAAECAAKLKASKIIFLTDGHHRVVDQRTGKNIQSIRLAQAISLLELVGIHRPDASRPMEVEPPLDQDAATDTTTTTATTSSPTTTTTTNNNNNNYSNNNSPSPRKNTPESTLATTTKDIHNNNESDNNKTTTITPHKPSSSSSDRIRSTVSVENKLNVSADIVPFLHLISRYILICYAIILKCLL